MYGLHFYAAPHKQYLRNKAITALNRGIALFVSEFGTCESTGNGIIDYEELDTWFRFMEHHKLSWCNWSIADKNETSAALKNGASTTGNWTNSDLSESGAFIREKIIPWNKPILSIVKKPQRFNDNLLPSRIQNYPNPFNSTTHFQFYISSPQRVRIDIYNILGKKISSLLNRRMQAGIHNITFNFDYYSTGTYFYKYETESISQIRQMQLIN